MVHPHSAVSSPSVSDTIDGRYLLKREIGQGAVGIVFEALHVFTGRAVAIKLLHRGHEHRGASRQRLLREARVLGASRHPGIVEVLDAGVWRENEPYLALEMLDGRALDGILTVRSRLAVDDVVHIGRQLCEALSVAHARNVVHRDIKPSNLFLARNELGREVLKVFDFGVAKPATFESVEGDIDTSPLSIPGELIGTPEYMAPEQLLATEEITCQCDIYAAGVTLYECLTGDVPFGGAYGDILMKVAANQAPPSVRSVRADVSANLASVIERALTIDRRERFPDARSFAQALVQASGLASGYSSLLGLSFPKAPGGQVGLGKVTRPPLPAWATPPRGLDPSSVKQPSSRGSGTPLTEPAGVPMGMQRRRFARAPYVTPVRIVQSDGEVLEARSEDVSEGGFLVVMLHLCRDNEPVQVSFALPLSGTMVTVSAIARWARSARVKGAAGLEFTHLSDEVRGAIATYVQLMRAPEE